MSYRSDPEWIACQLRWTADKTPQESAANARIRRLIAINEMYLIELRYERVAPSQVSAA